MKVKKEKKIKEVLWLLAMRQISAGQENPALFFSPPIVVSSQLDNGGNSKRIKRSLKGEKSEKK
jgi:hypothetical protein